jgi:cytidylate kinase
MPLITITQSIGSDGLAVARRVANDLHVGLYDDPKLREEAVRMGLDVGKLDGFQEKAPTWFHRLMGDKPEVYAHLIGSVIYEAARSGDGVIIGHGSQVLLKDFSCAMHVLVTATTERRINNLMGQNLTREAAEKVIRKSDTQNKEFFRFTFHRHWDDPSLYDLCINPDKIGIERASQTIVETARYPELKACNIYALDAIERFSLTKRIEAALVEMNLLPMGTLVEMPEKGIVRISGVLDDQEDEERIAKVVRSIPGVEKLDLDVLIVPAGYV